MGLLFTHCLALFMHCLHIKNIKNGSHDTIYTFKNYFATVFSVFSFQFSATISSIQTDPEKRKEDGKRRKTRVRGDDFSLRL